MTLSAVSNRANQQIRILNDLGVMLSSSTTILDFGCGNGDLVREYINRGYNAYGCDYQFKPGQHVSELERKGALRRIGSESVYRLPFEDEMFDLIISDQVFEHVADYASTIAELGRVSRSNAVGLHIFPSRYIPVEPHVNVPFAGSLQSNWWLRLWAMLGVRTENQRGWRL